MVPKGSIPAKKDSEFECIRGEQSEPVRGLVYRRHDSLIVEHSGLTWKEVNGVISKSAKFLALQPDRPPARKNASPGAKLLRSKMKNQIYVRRM
jgi:hypothetical protein